jgi:nicotinate-nucleotide--dimethylbenzimidazole phosphoribosyltransferase
MSLLEETCARITEPAEAVRRQTQELLDAKTKPRRSLGRLEDLACQIAAVRGDSRPSAARKAVVVMGADHGVADEGVSAYPAEVTAQMMLNFAGGGAAINVLARHAGARVLVVDMGVRVPVGAPGILDRRVGPGTRNFTQGPAMTREQAIAALETGIRIAADLHTDGTDLCGIGDMGIGNTTASSALAAVLTGAPVEEVTGRGTGIDDATLARKIDAIRRAIAANRPDAADAVGTLAKLGGFEIAGLAGVTLGCAALRIPVIADGFIAGAAALVAARIAPAARGSIIASHRSVEAGHRLVLRALGAEPLLDLGLRLGEGTGAALAMTLADAALEILHEMATFASAAVTDTGK